jgi:hypothetical protein
MASTDHGIPEIASIGSHAISAQLNAGTHQAESPARSSHQQQQILYSTLASTEGYEDIDGNASYTMDSEPQSVSAANGSLPAQKVQSELLEDSQDCERKEFIIQSLTSLQKPT